MLRWRFHPDHLHDLVKRKQLEHNSFEYTFSYLLQSQLSSQVNSALEQIKHSESAYSTNNKSAKFQRKLSYDEEKKIIQFLQSRASAREEHRSLMDETFESCDRVMKDCYVQLND